ncbi:hypothetical protein [Haloferula sp. BvORR071]|uniref:hypothetical protein n=1 Tax=Haloferula sp. BvORR071 TaxID=1396141 RepID=UPI002240F741|nr:hypothetical protein [Haloferula sp. BvORR071]
MELSPEAAAADIRRVCRETAGKSSVEDLQSIYDVQRLKQLVGQLDLEHIHLLRDDSELLQQGEGLAAIALSFLRERCGELAPGEVLNLETYKPANNSGFKVFDFVDLLRGAAKGDPEAAFAFWKDHLQDFSVDTEQEFGFNALKPLFAILEGAAQKSPAKAWEIISRLDSAQRTDQVLGTYFRSLPPGSDWEEAIGQLRSCEIEESPGHLSSPALALAQAWMKANPAATMQWLDSINDNLAEARTGSLAIPRKGDDALGARAAVYSQALQPWLYTDPIEAIHWLRNWEPADVSKLEIIREAMNGTTPAIERELLATVESPEERSQLVLALARDARDKDDFDILLAADNLPENTVKELERMKALLGPGGLFERE